MQLIGGTGVSALAQTDADTNMLISLHVREIIHVLVSSISFKQHTSLFLINWNKGNYLHATKRVFLSVENNMTKE